MTQIERESMEVDVLYVGAGPATLASAIHLTNQVEAFNRRREKSGRPPIEPPSVLVLEKSASVGDHMLSGGVMNPKAIRELVPGFESEGFPTEYVCDYAGFWLFHPKGKLNIPVVPPNFRKKGYHVVSLSNVAKWLGERAEAGGTEIYPGFAADELLVEGGRVVGVRTGDMGVDKDGKPKATFQPGMDIFAKVTVIGEGVRGTLAKQMIDRFDLEGANPQTFETGVKEIWRINPKKHQSRPRRARNVVPGHPEGLPRDVALRHEGRPDLLRLRDAASTREPPHDPHLEAQKFKTNPCMQRLLEARSSFATARRRSRPAGSTPSRSSTWTERCSSETRRACATPRTSPGSTWRSRRACWRRRRSRRPRQAGLHVDDARRLRGALPEQLGVRGALPGAQLRPLDRARDRRSSCMNEPLRMITGRTRDPDDLRVHTAGTRT